MEFSPERLGNIAAAFRRVAEVHAADGYAPIYQQMAAGVADDPELLAIAATAAPGQNPPILLLAAAQFLLIDHPDDPLVRFYPVLSGEPAPERDPYPALRDFVLAHRDAVTEIVATRLVQTNEPGRSSLLYPALLAAQRLDGGRPLALIEVGASAGLTLVPDRYAYDYDTGARYGDPASPLVLTCALRGELVPPLTGPLTVAWRTGIDLNPLSLNDPADRRWLRALVWPDHPGRAQRLDLAARAAARGRLPVIHRGNAAGKLPALLAQAPAGTTVVVYHTAVLSHFTDQDRTKFVRTLPELSARRPFTWVQGESGLDRVPRLRVAQLADGQIQAEHVLGHYHPHGAWLEWLDADLAG
ncbi:MAG TPA: DUF2332 domain-containing protein [Pseudonocardiaceae bacterium]|nr:DUF2332 domain-containing protein [Pseudonocardiaceae bacterium]